MRAHQEILLREELEVSPNRHLGNAEPLAEVGDRRAAALVDQTKDFPPALFGV
jgi:hypothetical protein